MLTHAIGIVIIFSLGFGAGRVHHASQLKTKILALEALVVGEAKAAYAKVRSLL